ncbi:MAG: DUF1674 domain-containing protein [Actinomycetospora chiangmaiensis]|nr:DUF1674 domain-containing protein [Actinomycetospora chiangmaiensis]
MQDQETESAKKPLLSKKPPLSPAAERALAEAAERRAAIDARAAAIQANPERQGRGGLEPVRYEDWEVKGLAVDF